MSHVLDRPALQCMEDDLDKAITELLEAVARIPAKRLPKRESGKKLQDQVSQTDPAGTKAP